MSKKKVGQDPADFLSKHFGCHCAAKDAEIARQAELIKDLERYEGELESQMGREVIRGQELKRELREALAENAGMRALVEKIVKLKPRWDDKGSFYELSDVDPVLREARAALANGGSEK